MLVAEFQSLGDQPTKALISGSFAAGAGVPRQNTAATRTGAQNAET